LNWNDPKTQLELLEQVTFRKKGLGAFIAEGMYSMAKILGPDAMSFCYHVKGVSRGPHSRLGSSLADEMINRGACNLRGKSWMQPLLEYDPADLVKKLLEHPDEFPSTYESDPG
jgi:aldehyde:ferredoxin oxidoreductase